MKRVLAFLLTAVLLLSAIPFAGADFTDADKITAAHKEAVGYVSGKKVISGFPDGTFQPQGNLTRAQAAKILCVALEGAEKADALTKTETGFSDVPASHWAAKFVAYCAEKGIVAGVGEGKFDPDAALTAAAFGKMLLVAYGRAKAEELTGKDWVVNTQKAMRQDNLKEGLDNVGNTPTTRENACHIAYNFMRIDEIEKADPEKYKQTKIGFTDGKNYRLLGRAKQTAEGVLCDLIGDGVEFTIDCKGTILVNWYVDGVGSWEYEAFRVLVDGNPGKRMSLTVVGDSEKEAYLRVTPGEHTIRIVKEREISGVTNVLKDMTVFYAAGSMQATQPRPKLLVSIGDSTSAGYGTDITDTPSSTKNSCSSVFNYTNLVAETLNMDYEMVVKGTTGMLRTIGTPPHNEREIFEYQNIYRDEKAIKDGKKTGEPERYSFARKADAVIIKISNNDNKFPKEEEEAALRGMISRLRELYGEKLPIALIFFSSNTHVETADKLAAEDPLIVCVRGVHDGAGMGKHTSAATHVKMAERLVEALKPLMGN